LVSDTLILLTVNLVMKLFQLTKQCIRDRLINDFECAPILDLL